jgi:hypothetical protein
MRLMAQVQSDLYNYLSATMTNSYTNKLDNNGLKEMLINSYTRH